jgi:hypothetical protein
MRGKLGDNIVLNDVSMLSSSTKHVACVLLQIKMFALHMHITYNLSPEGGRHFSSHFALADRGRPTVFATNIYTMGMKGLWMVSFVVLMVTDCKSC